MNEVITLTILPHTVSFSNKEGELLGKLIFDDKELKFEGNADESAKVFFELLKEWWEK